MNITIWLASTGNTTQVDAPVSLSNIDFNVYPNPVNKNRFDVSYSLLERTSVTIKLFDVTGRMIRSILHENNFPGTFNETIDIDDLKEGIYLCMLSTGNFSETKRILVQNR